MITVTADKYLYDIRSFLPEEIDLKLYDPENGLPGGIGSSDALLIRTVTAINSRTLSPVPDRLQFIGTASAGSDHVDIGYLRKNGVAFSDAAGCNARSVAEYIAAVLFIWSERRSGNPSAPVPEIGIVGAGHVGSELIALLNRLKIPSAAYDPPREQREPGFESVPLEKVLSCDILTFHTPLHRTGRYPTRHWMNRQKFQNRRFSLLVNTSRGGVVDEKALLEAHERGHIRDFVIDVWENEPEIDLETAEKAFIKTPHIAGYSAQAKENASRIIAGALLKHFDLAPPDSSIGTKPRTVEKPVSEFQNLSQLLTTLHPVLEYEQALRDILRNHAPERGKHFNRLRAEFPLRQEFGNICLPEPFFERFPQLEPLGFGSGCGEPEQR